MQKCNKPFRIFTLILLLASFLFAPVNVVMADDAASGKTTSESDKDADKKKKEKGKDGKGKGKEGKGEDGEEPDCE